jgi:hypothetical protein
MRARESSGWLALFPTSPQAVARGVCWRDGGGAHPGVMAEDGAHGPALRLHRLGESPCRTYQPSNASGSGWCKTVTGSLSRWPARCWVRVRGTAVGNAFKPRCSSPPPSGRGQRRRGRWQRPCALPRLRQGRTCRRASPGSRCNASGARCTRAPYACGPSSRWGGGPAGTCSRGRLPRRKKGGHGRRFASKAGEMERSGMRRHRCADRRGGRSLRRGGLDDSSAERHRGPARRAGVR